MYMTFSPEKESMRKSKIQKISIFVEDTFDSAHWLPNVPDTHKCHKMHGHTYKIRFEITGTIGTDTGWIIDYAEVKGVWASIKNMVDHKCLNEIPFLENPTCERLALWIASLLKKDLPGVSKIEIRETEHCGVSLDCQ